MDNKRSHERPSSREHDAEPRGRKRRRADGFRSCNHSLRISASSIAAMTGYHPWKNLPELFLFGFVYQGLEGKLLMQQDADLLGLSIVDPDDVLKELAKKAGTSAEAAVKEALCVKAGKKIVHDVQSASLLKNKVIKEAEKKLSKTELRILEQGVRSAVDTGYGTAHENDALDLFEKQTGWSVQERNAEIRSWPFRLHEGADGPTVVPMDKPFSLATLTAEQISEEQKLCIVDLTGDDSSLDKSEERNDVDSCNENESKEEDERGAPFFFIVGCIDGIREELAPSEKNCDDDDSWILRQVIVECKHRMKKLQTPPPLYDQIQAVCYCFMYEVENADIIQVLRTQDGKDDGNPQSDQKMPAINPKIDIHVNRVSLDDPVMQHRQQWKQSILPRLRSVAEAVYRVRADDDKRYRLLASLCDPSDDSQELAWKLLFTELEWLESCDTAFHKK